MSRTFFFLALLSFTLYGQDATNSIHKIVEQERNQIVKLDTSQLYNSLIIPSEFAQEILLQPKIQQQLQELTLIAGYYVYTQYKLNPEFSQKTLDKNRFEKLNQFAPSLLANHQLQWKILEQTGCQDFTEGKNYFHGFVIVHRPIITEANRLDEFNRINKFFQDIERDLVNPIEDPIAELLTEKKTEIKESVTEVAFYDAGEFELYQHLKSEINASSQIGLKRFDAYVDFTFDVGADSSVTNIVFKKEYPDFVKEEVLGIFDDMEGWIPAMENSTAFSSTVDFSVRISYSPTVKGLYKRDGQKPGFKGEEMNPLLEHDGEKSLPFGYEEINPSTISTYTSLEKYVDKKEKLSLVMDVTGSMAPYIAAITRWVLSNHSDHPFTSFTFFNDGDDKPTKKKKIGSTGGIYYSGVDQDIRTAIKNAMINGNGGERPENDVEAILEAQNKDEDSDAILLLGDNWSEVRDLELLKDVRKTVNVLICGDRQIPRTDYITIAWKTGGDLIYDHIVYNFKDLKPRETVSIGNYKYRFDGEEFKFMN